MRRLCVKLFYGVMFIVFSLLFIFTIFYNKSSYANLKFYETIVAFVGYCLFLFILWKFLLRRINDSKKFYIIFSIIFIILQLLFAFIFAVRPSWDFGAVNDSVFWDLDNNLKIADNVYFYRYSNNVGMFLLLKTIYFPFFLCGANHFILLGIGLLFNILFIDLGIFYLYRVLNLFFSKNQTKYFFLISLLYLPFITYVPIFYTDTYSLPFAIMSIYYLFVYLYKNNRKLNLILCGLFLGIGCFIKFSLFIVFIAIILFLIFRNIKIPVRKFVVTLSFIAICFSLPLLALQAYIHFIFDSELLQKESFPKEHYLMMGLSNFGGYNLDDVEFTMNISGINNKKRKDLERMQQKIKQLWKEGTIWEFYINKAVYTWGDGTYFAPRKLSLEPINNYSVKKIILDSSENSNYLYKCISQAQIVFVLFFISASILFYKHLNFKQKDLHLLLNIIIFGAFLFFMLWEARSRYIVNFIPILLIDSYLGVLAIYNYLKSKKLICK